GFSLIELLIAMAIIIIGMGVASKLLAQSFGIRTREDTRSDAIADAQRALNIMSREIANSGFGLTDNGVVPADSNDTSIRIRANLNAYLGQTTGNAVADRDEDVKYIMYVDDAAERRYLVRYDVNLTPPLNQTVLANRIDFLNITYFDPDGNQLNVAATPALASRASRLVITVGVTLPAVGAPGASNHQPASQVQLSSSVVLRNARLLTY
ncbi:MAG: prepilin-type N-terminal cleavage/methylation domain-containing protein, partial [Pyrinomonadaceae bacterium]|nr:prepilin-type N-terminal cleavage/methylation domain-containing protein [Pyrinomonadaceae bacterium]